MSERAMVRRRFRPPDNGSTLSLARSASWTNSSNAAARSLMTRRGSPKYLPYTSRFSTTVSSTSRVSSCGTTPSRPRVAAQDGQFPGGRRRDAADHPHRGGFTRAIRPEEAERLTPVQVEVDAVYRRETPEPLGQAACADEYFTFG